MFTAVDDVSLSLEENRTIGIVGESGSGKTTLAKLILGIEKPDSGSITVAGSDISAISAKELKALRPKIQVIFQDPYSSMDPRMKVRDIVLEPVRINKTVREPAKLEELAVSLLRSVGLGEDALDRYPHEFSGGQRQRICIARALSLKPSVIIADEPISSLDISIQAQIMNLLNELKEKYKLSYIFISHDLSAVYYLCDHVAVMYKGNVVEYARSGELFSNTQHPYTKLLLSAVPDPDPDKKSALAERKDGNAGLSGGTGNGSCVFSDRCPYAEPRCVAGRPPDAEIAPGHFARCVVLPFKK